MQSLMLKEVYDQIMFNYRENYQSVNISACYYYQEKIKDIIYHYFSNCNTCM